MPKARASQRDELNHFIVKQARFVQRQIEATDISPNMAGWAWRGVRWVQSAARELAISHSLPVPPRVKMGPFTYHGEASTIFEVAVRNVSEATAAIDQYIDWARSAIARIPKHSSRRRKRKSRTPAPPSRGKRKNFVRDHEWRKLYLKPNSDTRGQPAVIRDKWNAEHPDDQVSADVVKKGIRKAIKEAKRGTGKNPR
jgi:hypothetical protein